MLRTLRRKIWLSVLGNPAPAEENSLHAFETLVEDGTRTAGAMRAAGYLEFPQFVHIETLALCNAACEFCPYPAIGRKGTKMPDALIEKVISDLAAGPKDLPFMLAPYKVSEPFLEPRLFDIMERVAERLPNARVVLISNGAALTPRKLDALARSRNVASLCISLNFDNAADYESAMKIPFEATLRRVDELHSRAAAGGLPFTVHVASVSGGREADLRFIAFARQRFPAFRIRIAPRNDWLGDVITPGAAARIPDAPCHRWFDMSIVATGEVAMCCMDGDARFSKGNAAVRHVLEIYNQPHLRRLRETLMSRRHAAAPCASCTYVSG